MRIEEAPREDLIAIIRDLELRVSQLENIKSDFDIVIEYLVDFINKCDDLTFDNICDLVGLEMEEDEDICKLLDNLTCAEYIRIAVFLLRYINKNPEQTEEYYKKIVIIVGLISSDFDWEYKNEKYFITWSDSKRFIIKNTGKVIEL